MRNFYYSLLRIFSASVIGSVLVMWLLYFNIPRYTLRVEVPLGSKALSVISSLRDKGLIMSRTALYALFRASGTFSKIKAGIYEFDTRQNMFSIWQKLVRGQTLKIKVTVPEGFSVKQIAELLDAKGVCDKAGFERYAAGNSLEGYLFPETYFIEYFATPEQIASMMTRQFDKHYIPEFEQLREKYNFTKEDVVILASIIEKESRKREDKPMISRVFHNRLKKRMYLESCATVQYALGGWKKRLSFKDLKVQSPYNTYLHFGLPPAPICNPGYDSLYAALQPADSDALYFVADGLGNHKFFTRYSDHLSGRESLRKFRREYNNKSTKK